MQEGQSKGEKPLIDANIALQQILLNIDLHIDPKSMPSPRVDYLDVAKRQGLEITLIAMSTVKKYLFEGMSDVGLENNMKLIDMSEIGRVAAGQQLRGYLEGMRDGRAAAEKLKAEKG